MILGLMISYVRNKCLPQVGFEANDCSKCLDEASCTDQNSFCFPLSCEWRFPGDCTTALIV